MDVVTLIITLLTTLLAAIGVGLGLVWKYFTEQDAKKTEIILNQVEEAKTLSTVERQRAETERQRADLIQSQFLNSLDKLDKRSETSANKQDKIMEKHLKALQDLQISVQQLVDKASKERS